MADILIPTVAQGLMWALMALGVYITFRVLDIADLSVEGSFPLGAAVAATALVSGYGVTAAFLLAAVAGALAGIVTGILTTKLKIPPLLAGILTMIGLYSVNLHVMGKANVALLRVDTVFSYAAGLGLTSDMAMMAVGLVGVMLVGVILYWFFGTEIGCGIRATGANACMARAQGINTQRNVVVGLALSNGIAALSGALLCQYQGSADVNMGRGAIVIGLAAVIIGESLLGKVFRNFGLRMLSVSLGAIVYYLVLQVVLQLGLNTNDLKLLSAAIVAVFLAVPHLKGKLTHKGGTVHA